MIAAPMTTTVRPHKTTHARMVVRGSRRARGLQLRLKEESFFNVIPLILAAA
jgi:hypothetical protein